MVHRAALLTGLLFAVNPLFVQFAQDARGYSLALLFVSASCYFFVRGVQRDGPAPRFCWTAFTVVTALAAYCNFWAALVPVGQALSLAFLPPGRIPWRRIVSSAVALVVLLVPLALLIKSTDSAGVNWASGSSAGRLFTHIRSSVPHVVLDAAALVAVVVVVGGIVLARRRPRIGALFEREWPLFFTVCWLVVPVGAVVLLSLVDKPLLVIRYLMVSLPAAVLLAAGRGGPPVVHGSARRPCRGRCPVRRVGRRIRPRRGAVVLEGRAGRLPSRRCLHRGPCPAR